MWTERTEMLLGPDALGRLGSSHAVVVGLGGVGAYAAEMLVRSGLGKITIIDSDEVSETNINRQLIALRSTMGRKKTEVLRERLLDINPQLKLTAIDGYVHEDSMEKILGPLEPNVIIDAIDTLSPKIALIQYALSKGIWLVSSMGAGAKTDATAVRVADISKTYQCPLAHALRKRLHRLGINEGFQAVFSTELPRRDSVVIEESRNKKSQVGTISYLPAVFGCICAQAAICHITGIE